ncbi:hypothetical protein [Oleidesulfovibrio alaskensis]|jgi:hypothetical protein|uniref:hypothetical protein n=1 Tax=Oleidesulfovibrio alaskensis TaxID=58180 RepID=UPI00041F76B0|nr:hypothetical protein [Oleidesulfovibrio alaskensis]
MIIEWRIVKKRGNYRPELCYSITLEPFERELAVPQVLMESSIPCPPCEWEPHCLPGTHERAGRQPGVYRLYTPDHKRGEATGRLRLPWREEQQYPEVEESFRELRARFEVVLKNAYDSAPADISGCLELTQATRSHIACGVVRQQFLQVMGL